MKVRLTHIDGKLPNLALMKLAHFHRSQGDDVYFTRNVQRELFEDDYDRVYGSAIFTRSLPLVHRLLSEFPNAIVGGTGAEEWRQGQYGTVESFLGLPEYEHYDYLMYPDFTGSIGFTARGCRLKCSFCIVPIKEGKPRSVNAISDIWRGEPYPKHLHLLDNDFFGQAPEQWEARMREILDGGFRVCFNQGINVRLISREIAQALAKLPYYDDSFKVRRIYTAWDNFKDESIFLRGVNHLLDAGIRPDHILVYMLIGYDKTETWERIFHRFNVMVSMGLQPYPMVYNNQNRDLKLFQKWVVRRYYEIIPWADFVARKGDSRDLHDAAKNLDASGGRIDRKRARRIELESERAQPILFS